MKQLITVLYRNPVEREWLLKRLATLSLYTPVPLRLSKIIDAQLEIPAVVWCADLPFALTVKERSPVPLLLLHPLNLSALLSLLEDHRVASASITADDRTLVEKIQRLIAADAFAFERSCYLTARETEVVRLIASGFDTATIASKLGIKQSTIAAHKKRIFLKSGVRSTNELVAWTLLRTQQNVGSEGRG